MNIDWQNKPDWADVWIETIDPRDQVLYGGWHKSDGEKWVDGDDRFWRKVEELPLDEYRVHYPPVKQEENIMNKERVSKEEALKQLATLQAEMDKLKAIIDKPVKWEPSGGDWYICHWGAVQSAESYKGTRAFGLEFDNKEDAEKAFIAYRQYHRLYKWVMDNDDGWRANWNSTSQSKYYVFYNHRESSWRCNLCTFHAPLCVIYMSKTNAEKLAAALNSGEVVL